MEKAAATTFLSLGSNLGDRELHIREALRFLAERGLQMEKISNCYETEPVGRRNQPWFLNIAVMARTALSPQELLSCCLEAERRAGRSRSLPNAPRTLDVDILLFGDLILEEQNLIIPHPRLTERKFVLQPLAEIAPQLLHPALGETAARLLAACKDTSIVRTYTPGEAPQCHRI